MASNVKPITYEWLDAIPVGGYIVYDCTPNTTMPYKYVADSDVRQGTFPRNAAVINSQRQFLHNMVFTEHSTEPRSYHVFAAVDQRVLHLRANSVCARLNDSTEDYATMILLYPGVLFHDFDFVPMVRGGMVLSAQLSIEESSG